MANRFLVEGRRNYKLEMVVDVRWPGVTYAQPASATLTENETLELIARLQDALSAAQAENAE
jgi:hypothetical protein